MRHLHTPAISFHLIPAFFICMNLLGALSMYAQSNDSLEIITLYNKGWSLIETDPDSAAKIIEKAKAETDKRGYKPGIITYYNYQAALEIKLGNIEKAQVFYERAIAMAKKNNLEVSLGETYMKYGTLCQFMNEYGKAAENFIAAALFLTKNEERKKVIGLYSNIISTLVNLKQQNQSLKHVLPALKNNNTNENEITSILSQNKTNEPNLEFPDNTTLREVTGGNIYVILGGAKFQIGNFFVLGNYSNYRSVKKIPDGMISRIPNIPHDGTILKQLNDGGKVYLVKGKQRHQIENPAVLQYFGGWDVVGTVPHNTLEQIPDAGEMVTLENVMTTYNFKKEIDVLVDSLKSALALNKFLLLEVGSSLKTKNNEHERRKILLWTSSIGIIALLTMGLQLYRHSRQKQKLHRQSLQALKAEDELQQKIALEKERTRIATDMHDDLGAGLSKIRFLSETVHLNISEEAHKPHLQNISNSSVELVDKFNEIIWAMNEKNNSLDDLLYYIRNYTAKYCEENDLKYQILIPDIIPAITISGEIRRHIFLAVKEALHNIIKHACARHVSLQVVITESLTIVIGDDGKGFALEKMRTTGNGLRSMDQRMKSIRGKLSIKNNTGTIVTMTIPLPIEHIQST